MIRKYFSEGITFLQSDTEESILNTSPQILFVMRNPVLSILERYTHSCAFCVFAVFIMKSPGPYTGEYNSFVMERVFRGAVDDTTCLDWSCCSRLLAIGSKDMSTRIYSLDKFDNFRSYLLGGHSHMIVGCFFEKNSFDITTISRNGQVCIWDCNFNSDELVVAQPSTKKKRENSQIDDEEDDVNAETIVENPHNSKQVFFLVHSLFTSLCFHFCFFVLFLFLCIKSMFFPESLHVTLYIFCI